MRFRPAQLALVVVALLALPGAATAKPWIGVKGNRLVDRHGETVRLLGVNRSGAEYACVEEGSFFDSPTDAASIEAMKSWHINAVRLPLNESCWLGIGEVRPDLGGSAYRTAVRGYVEALEQAGLYVILDLHWAAPSGHTATGLLLMPDADNAAEFWRSVASEYRGDRSVLFDLFNEPHDVGWACWLAGCQMYDRWFGLNQAVGMAELLAVVRSTGARQPVLLAGLDWASEPRGWLAHVPADPAQAIVASVHSYDYLPCMPGSCRKALANIARRYPVVTGELGEIDCRRRYVNPYMDWADRHGISYLGWTWNTEGRWDCAGGPSLIRDWTGNPTPYGVGLKRHLERLAAKWPPPSYMPPNQSLRRKLRSGSVPRISSRGSSSGSSPRRTSRDSTVQAPAYPAAAVAATTRASKAP